MGIRNFHLESSAGIRNFHLEFSWVGIRSFHLESSEVGIRKFLHLESSAGICSFHLESSEVGAILYVVRGFIQAHFAIVFHSSAFFFDFSVHRYVIPGRLTVTQLRGPLFSEAAHDLRHANFRQASSTGRAAL